MEKNIWQILEIEATTDIKEIKKAYSKLLKETDLNDIQKFQSLKEAFDQARKVEDISISHPQEPYDENIDTYSPLKPNLATYVESLTFCHNPEAIRQLIIDINQLDLNEYIHVIKGLYQYISQAPENYDLQVLKIVCDELKNVDEKTAVDFAEQINQLPLFPFYEDENFKTYHRLRYEAFNQIKLFQFEDAQETLNLLLTDFPQFENEVKTLQIMLHIIKQQVTQSPKKELISQFELSQQLLIKDPHNQTLLCCFLYLAYITKKGHFKNGELELVDLDDMNHNYLAHDSIYTLAVYQLIQNINELNEKTKIQVKAFQNQRFQKTLERKETDVTFRQKAKTFGIIVVSLLVLSGLLKIISTLFD